MRMNGCLFLMMSCVFAFLSTQASASPAINPGAMFSFLDSGKRAMLKRIYNSGTSTAFVKVVVQEIIYDVNGQPTELPPKALSNAPLAQQDMLVASPARMIIPAKGMQATRLLFIGERAKERYYRVRFIPVLPTKADSFDLSADDRKAYKNELAAEVTLLTGYGTVLFVRPDKVTFDTRLNDEKETYSITNAGNSIVMLDFFKSCDARKPATCSALAQHYILPGNTYRFKKDKNRTHSFVLLEGTAQRKVTVKGS